MKYAKETEFFRQKLDISNETLIQLIQLHARDFLTVNHRLSNPAVSRIMALDTFKVWWIQLWHNADKAMYHNLSLQDDMVIRDDKEEINRPLSEYYHIYHRHAVRLTQLPDFIEQFGKGKKIKSTLTNLNLKEEDGVWKPLKGAPRHDTSAIAPGETNRNL